MLKTNIKVVQGRSGLHSIKEDWRIVTEALSDKRFYHFYEWYQCYLENLEIVESSVYFFVFYKCRKPVAVFPLKRVQKIILGFHFNAFEIPNNDFIDLSDFICSDQESIGWFFRKLIDYLSKETHLNWDFILIPHLLEKSKMFQYVETSKNKSFNICEDAGRCNYIPCAHLSKVQKNFSKNFKANLRKAKNKIRRNKSTFVYACEKPEILENYIEFLDVEASGWKGEAKTAIKCYPNVTEYYRDLIKSNLGGCKCEINLLKMGEEYIAGQFCVYVEDVCYLLKIGYKEEYSRFSPGNILLENLIERIAKNQNVNYINLVTGSKWHNDWKPESYKVYRVLEFRKSFKGVMAFMLSKIKQTARPFFYLYIKPVVSKSSFKKLLGTKCPSR